MNTSEHVTVRPIGVDDAAAVYDIRRQPEVQRFTYAMASERRTDWISTLGPNDHVFVAEVDGRVVGIAGLHLKEGKHRHVGWVGLAVHDAFVRRGIGRALTSQLLDMADNTLGLVRVQLEVFADNEPAIKLYRALGFVEEGRQRKAYFRGGAYVDALMMARIR